jgi:23S rRNA (cytosine1962-C5)-methyltransferase
MNVRAMDWLAPGARVFDGHCYAGLWSCRAAKAGAKEVVGVDTSEAALARARRNAELNGADKVHFEAADVLEKLQGEERYDVVIIDPPALAKSRAHLTKALGLYQALNRAAMEAVQPGGCLVSSCCSHFVDRESFLEVLKRAARSSQRDAQLIELRGPSPDHPELLEMPETSYFTCAILRIF